MTTTEGASAPELTTLASIIETIKLAHDECLDDEPAACRALLRDAIEALSVHAAAPAAPDAQPVAWTDAERIRDLPVVDNAIRALLEDNTGDNATALVRAVLEAGAAPAAPDALHLLRLLDDCINNRKAGAEESTVERAEAALGLAIMAAGAAPVARPAAYIDSTPHLNVGNSAFEHWFQAQPFATQPGIKQISRDSYAAGMGDPLVTAAAHPQQPAALLVRDLAADVGVAPLAVCELLESLGFGPHSVNMAVTVEAARAVTRHYAAHPRQPAAEPALAHPLPTTPVVAHGLANVSHSATKMQIEQHLEALKTDPSTLEALRAAAQQPVAAAVARAWADLPAQLQCHPGIKALHRAALEQPAATVRQALSDTEIVRIAETLGTHKVGHSNYESWGQGYRRDEAGKFTIPNVPSVAALFARAIERAHGIGAKDTPKPVD